MKRHIVSACVVALLVTLSACSSSKTSLAAYYDYETTCIGTELDGSLTLRAWGEGRDKKDAVEQAMKRAVHDVIFSGITRGTSGENMRPLISEANAEQTYQDYFNAFFADRGPYADFATFQDEKSGSKQVFQNAQVYKYGATVRVLRSQLKQRLKDDGIIK